MTTAADILNAIEARAERAIVQELRLLRNEILKLRPAFNPEDHDHAEALLLKLGHIESSQIAVACDVEHLAPPLTVVAQAA